MQPIDLLVTSLQAVLPFVSKNCFAPALGALHVEPHPDGGALLVATNGKTLACSYDEGARVPAQPLDLVFPRALTTLLTSRPNRDVGRLHVAEDMSTSLNNVTYTLAPSAYVFPDYRHVLANLGQELREAARPGTSPSAEPWGLAADRLARVAKAAHHAYQYGTGNGEVALQINDAAPTAGLVVTSPEAPKTFWVLAKNIVTSARPALLPDWLPAASSGP